MIWMLGDVHGDIAHLPALVAAGRPAAVIFLGDIEAPQPLDEFVGELADLTEIWWIPGNHDTDTPEHYMHLYESPLAGRNLHGRVAEIAGLRIAGLGGVFRGKVWYPPAPPQVQSLAELAADKYRHHKALTAAEVARLDRGEAAPAVAQLAREGQLRKHRSSIFHADWLALCGERADILVTHEAPSCHRHGFHAIDQLGRALGVRRAFHGHQHDSPDYCGHAARLGFAAHGVGFRGITDMHGRKVLAGRYDDAPEPPATGAGA